MQRTSYSIQITFRTGIKKTFGLVIAQSTFRHWDKTFKRFMPDSRSLKDAKTLINLARINWPKYDFKIIKYIEKRTILDY